MSSQGAQHHPLQPLVGTHIGWALGKDLLVCNLFEIFCVNPSLEFNWDSFFNLIGLASELTLLAHKLAKTLSFFTLMPSDYQVEHLDTHRLARKAIYGEVEAVAGL